MAAKAFAANKGPVKRLDLVGESAGVLTTLDQGSVLKKRSVVPKLKACAQFYVFNNVIFILDTPFSVAVQIDCSFCGAATSRRTARVRATLRDTYLQHVVVA